MIPAVHSGNDLHPAHKDEAFCWGICKKIQEIWNALCTWICELVHWLCCSERPLPIVLNRGDIALSSVDAFHNILTCLHPEDVGRCERVNRAWHAAIPAKEGRVWKTLCLQEHVSYQPREGEHKRAFSHPQIPTFAFGPSRWKKHFGDPGIAPTLPACIHRKLAILKDSCTLTLIPATLNGKPLTIESFAPLTISNEMHLIFLKENVSKTVSVSEPKSIWVLMKKRVVDGSQKMDMADAKRESQLGKALWITVSIAAHYFQEKFLLFAGHPPTYVRTCDEEVDATGHTNYVHVGGTPTVALRGPYCVHIMISSSYPKNYLYALAAAPVQSFDARE